MDLQDLPMFIRFATRIGNTKTNTIQSYNPSANILERWQLTIVGILRAMEREIQDELDLGVKAASLAYNTTMHTNTWVRTHSLP